MSARAWSLRLAAAAFVPATLSGCEVPEALGGKGAAPPAAADAAKADGWIIVKEGQRPAEEEPAAAPAEAPEKPLLEVPHLPELPHVEAAEPLDPRCVGAVDPSRIAGLDVDAGATTATVRWYHPGDPSVLSYRITSINQELVVGRQDPLVWQETKPGEHCATLTATVTGLRPDTPYVFSVDVVRQATWQNTGRAYTVARSGVITTD